MSARSSARSLARARSSSNTRGREVGGVLFLALGVFLFLSLSSFQFSDGSLMGPLGHWVAGVLYGGFGIAANLLAVALVVMPVRILTGAPAMAGFAEAGGWALGLISVMVLLHLGCGDFRIDGYSAGGVLGEYTAELLCAGVSTTGSVLFGIVGLVLGLVAATPLEVTHLTKATGWTLRRMGRGLRWAGLELARVGGEVICAILPERRVEAEHDGESPEWVEKISIEEAAPTEELVGDTIRVGDPTSDVIEMAPEIEPEIALANEPVIVEPTVQKKKPAKEKRAERVGDYKLPSTTLLKYDDTSVNIDKDAMRELAARLTNTLATYGIRGEVQAIRPGPVVTMYEFAPAPGTRVSKITNLADDLAMALEALSVRIVAPIPGKAVVGIEVPNKQRETVFLKEILDDDVFQKAKSKMSLALGKDSEGRPVAVDLAKMPHLLVAGTTGAGKSVSVNTMIASILYKSTPDEVRIIMVDPKMLELSVYEGIPHLLLPVVTDPRKANVALRWACTEMDRRYQLMAELAVRDILSYNKKVEKNEVEITIEDDAGQVLETAKVDAEELAEGSGPHRMSEHKKLPYIVIVIDEFADLMMCSPKEVEHSVTRIAQKARACGIHLLLATQRPTTEVITGLIKSNFPSRIAFRVTNKINSIAVLEQSGAEALLGQGDMLFSDRGASLRRVHGCLIQDDEIQALSDFWRKQGKPVYDMDILKSDEEEEGAEAASGEDLSDDMYDKAVALVAESRQASISMVQRRLRVGYNRAARMIERMEKEGIVGPSDGQSRREVLVQSV